MRFIHAADIHLDSPLTGLSAYADAPVEMLRTATRDAFTNLVNLAIEERVDFMVIAGDLYDGDWKDYNTGLYFAKEMGRLRKAGIPVYLLYGNHDAENEMTRKLLLPENVFVFDSRKPSTFRLDHLGVALHGRSFKDAATVENLAAGYPEPIAGMINIGVLHTALEGNAAHANYAPCSLAQLHAKGYQYWALGHVHEYCIWRGDAVVVFPGNLQGRHIRETGPRGAVLVHCNAAGAMEVERVHVDVLRWHRLGVDVSGCQSFAEAARAIGNALESLLEAGPAHMPLALRVVVSGQTAAHGELFGMEAQLRLEVLAAIAALGNDRLWLEKVRLETQALDDGQALRERADALADLQDLLESAGTDQEFLDGLRGELSGLVDKAPPELKSAIPYFADIKNGDLAALLREIRPSLVAHLAKVE
ncbi:metallophosphoesterase family protein [Pollutimonas bauzanensis]|uniref:DNA repair exonuclease SbcCD nuclease subunit n=1 Tax=Pollutimonas bauzanensis TaxID=658167 RepID=A0A1M5YFP2_9BURK|nr:DNA repair exonuclease [Pollutimonas bauzanensis]SHI10806.1 DNA repair exonuclease SbcCD nuclease subunit [Pollutimonas bauzanensis]